MAIVGVVELKITIMVTLLISILIKSRMSDAGKCSFMGACVSELSQAFPSHNWFIAPYGNLICRTAGFISLFEE